MEGTADATPSPPEALPARQAHGEDRLVDRWLKLPAVFVMETLVKAAFILFWFLLFSVIRLQAGF